MLGQFPLRAFQVGRQYLPLFTSNPTAFMSKVTTPLVCPEGLPEDIWTNVKKVQARLGTTFDDRAAGLDYFAELAGFLVRSVTEHLLSGAHISKLPLNSHIEIIAKHTSLRDPIHTVKKKYIEFWGRAPGEWDKRIKDLTKILDAHHAFRTKAR